MNAAVPSRRPFTTKVTGSRLLEAITMIDVLKRVLYTGVGIASLTREKLVELGHEISKQADLTEAQARDLEEELLRKGDEARKQLESEIDARVEVVLSRLGVARQEEVAALTARINVLEEQMQAVRTSQP